MSNNCETLEWIWVQARINADFQVQCSDALDRQATSLLNVLLAGGGGALAYAVNLFENDANIWLRHGITVTSIWLFIVAAILVLRVMWSGPIYGPANDPKNLSDAYEMDISEAYRIELKNRQKCIEHNRTRNDSVGFWLNICRILAIITPLVSAAITLLISAAIMPFISEAITPRVSAIFEAFLVGG